MDTRIFVGHLSFRANERDVEDFFSRYGKVREIVLKNGFGFIEFDDPRDASDAAERANGRNFCGERLIVQMTKRPPRGRSGGPGSGPGRFSSGNRYPPRHSPFRNRGPPYGDTHRRKDDSYPVPTKHRLIVENLSTRISWQELKEIMQAAGEVTYADAHRIQTREGIVCFRTSSDLKRAIDTLDGKELNGRRIKLIDGTRHSRSRSRSSSGSSRRSRSRSARRSRSVRSRSMSRSKSARSRSRSRSVGSRSASRSKSRSVNRSASRSRSRSRSPSFTGSAGRSNGNAKRSLSPTGSDEIGEPDSRKRPAVQNGQASDD